MYFYIHYPIQSDAYTSARSLFLARMHTRVRTHARTHQIYICFIMTKCYFEKYKEFLLLCK